MLLDELWLHKLLRKSAHPRMSVAVEQTCAANQASVPQTSDVPQVDWGEAPDVPSFYGREEELALLSRWVIEEHCRVVSVLGMGGIGKSALAVTAMHRVVKQFEVVIWRSLRDAPGCDTLLDECRQVLAPQRLRDLSASLEERLWALLVQMRARRVLLVLDNLEMLLEVGTGIGRMRGDLEGYDRLRQGIGETAHQSCLLLTSREKAEEFMVGRVGTAQFVSFPPDGAALLKQMQAGMTPREASAWHQEQYQESVDRDFWDACVFLSINVLQLSIVGFLMIRDSKRRAVYR